MKLSIWSFCTVWDIVIPYWWIYNTAAFGVLLTLMTWRPLSRSQSQLSKAYECSRVWGASPQWRSPRTVLSHHVFITMWRICLTDHCCIVEYNKIVHPITIYNSGALPCAVQRKRSLQRQRCGAVLNKSAEDADAEHPSKQQQNFFPCLSLSSSSIQSISHCSQRLPRESANFRSQWPRTAECLPTCHHPRSTNQVLRNLDLPS